MDIVKKIPEARQKTAAARRAGKRIGLVPTMGALHAGHASLIERAVRECDFTAVSIFVNPTQFGPREDLDKYPRTFEADFALCDKLGADLVFAPNPEEMYPQEQLAWVVTEGLTDRLCGASRAGHFRGVTTVCMKLFGILQPDIAYFGQKDAQQAVVIRRMVSDLNLALEIRVCPIIREKDGLAMSSRNRYLSREERQKALCLYQSLEHCRRLVRDGERNAGVLREAMREYYREPGVELEYIEIVDPETLKAIETIERTALASAAAQVGNTRLIDNLIIDLKNP